MTEEGRPEISVIVPVFNEVERLEENLRSLLAQQDAPSYEIIYVDDASTDGSWSKLVELSSRSDKIRIHRMERRRSVGAVRHRAVSLSRGHVIANMDADCIAPPGWLSHWTLLRGDVGVVGFPVIPPSDLEYLHWRFDYVGTGQYEPGSMPHGCGSLIRRDLLFRAGSFPDTSLGEDTRLFEALSRIGVRIVLLPSPPVTLLRKRVTLRGHLKRYVGMGRHAPPRSRRMYAALLGATLLLPTAAAWLWRWSPWLSLVLVLTLFGVLTNPRRVLEYVRSFRRPRNRVVRTACFAAIKFLETLSLLCGYLVSLRRDGEMRIETGEPPSSTHAPGNQDEPSS